MGSALGRAQSRQRAGPGWAGARHDPTFERLHPRVRRLAVVSSIALGLVWWLSLDVSGAGALERWGLLAGWVLMPATLVASLFDAWARFAVGVPASLVSLVALRLTWLEFPSAGWMLLAAGVLLGGMLGMWSWFRWAPIPAMFRAPYGRGRRALIAVHVALTAAGIAAIVAAE